MAKKVVLLTLVMALLVGSIGCLMHKHTVGTGQQGMAPPIKARQWYLLWGLIPLGEIDSKVLAGNATDYTIRTWVSPLDFIINILTGYVSIYSRTVEVYR